MNGKSKAKTPTEYIADLAEPRRSHIKQLHQVIRKTVPSLKPFMIAGLIGYGKYRFEYSSGRKGDWYLIGLASQKNYISLYVCAVQDNKYLPEHCKKQLPKASIGKSCIRFKKPEDVNLDVIKEIVIKAIKIMKQAQAGGNTIAGIPANP